MMGRLIPPIGESDHAAGSDDAMVTLVEFGDYECPYCGQAHDAVKALQQEFGDRLRFAFRNFPIASAHPHAVMAAEAAEAAGAQGRFWQMHDTLYEHQDALEPEDILAYATSIGVNRDRLQADLRSHRFDNKPRGRPLGRCKRRQWHADVLRQRIPPRRRLRLRFAIDRDHRREWRRADPASGWRLMAANASTLSKTA